MRGRPSSKQMETDKVIETKQEPQSRLSGAYIRTLVKHLTSKDPLDVSENSECNSNTQKPQRSPIEAQPPQHKKQVRRRLHTSKPYQERLLNMAEARREIVTALKFHRASMKQQEAAASSLSLQSPSQSSLGQEKESKSRSIHSLYPSTTSTAGTSTSTSTTTNSYWPISTYIPPPPPRLSYDDNQNFVLPTQSLGLNLNYQNFSNLDTNIYHKPMSMPIDSPPSSSSSAPSSSSSQALSIPAGKPNSSGDLHHAMDDDEMEEIRSLGEQHQIEWNDTINLMTSARWCSFLNTMKIEAEEGDESDGFHQFDQNMEFPSWLINANEGSCLQQHFDADAYFQDSALPCMDIGEIEAMDGEWLA